jgi:probable HAF family extracellular repeat protein
MGRPRLGSRPRIPPAYVACDLGTLGGASSCALAINERGQVVGWAQTAGGDRHAALWQDGKALDLGAPPGRHQSEACDINEGGLIVGGATGDGGACECALVWRDGAVAELPPLATTSSTASASAVNARGRIVGGYFTNLDPSASEHHAVLWDGEHLLDLGTLPEGLDSHAWDLNDRGEVVGVAQDAQGVEHAVLWEAGRITDLATPRVSESGARALNAAGDVVGAARSGPGPTHAFLCRNTRMVYLGTLPGCRHSRAYDINDLGRIVGTCAIATNRGLTPRALLWDHGQPLDLNDLIDPESGWDLTCARGLNKRGEIVGKGIIHGQERAFLLVPR